MPQVFSEHPTENMSEAERLQRELEEKKAANKLAAQQAEEMRLHNKVEEQNLKQRKWELAIKQMKVHREEVQKQHEKRLSDMKHMATEATENSSKDEAIMWLKSQLSKLEDPKDTEAEETACREQEEKKKMIEEVRKQRDELDAKLAELTGRPTERGPSPPAQPDSQETLLQQLQAALSTKGDMDPQKAILRALTTQSNKTQGPGGVHTLKPDLMEKLNTDLTGNHRLDMNEWLANFNKEDEGESLLRFANAEGEGECKHSKMKSGMLDRSTNNIHQKQVWSQKNLGEDWAEEELEFKQIRFEHLVAGETRTIELCTDPAQILGRLRLLRRIAYLRLRGYKWSLLRKMYCGHLDLNRNKGVHMGVKL